MNSVKAAGAGPRRLIVVLALLLVSLPACVTTTIDYADAEKRADGLTYERGTDKPFSGVVRDNNSDGSPRSSFSFVDGRRDGVSTRGHRNGNKQSEEIYVADSVWPSVALKKLVEGEVQVTEADLKQGFESAYGPRVEVLAIVLSDQRSAQKVWDTCFKSTSALE